MLVDQLRYAYRHCVFYTKFWDGVGVKIEDIRALDDVRNIPAVTKRMISESGHEMVSSAIDVRTLRSAKTGGSTGTALHVRYDKRCEGMRHAAALRSDRWAGWELGEMRAALWGNPPVATTWTQRMRSLLHDRMFYLDTMRLDDRTMGEFVAQWRRKRPTTLFGHAHSIYILATYLEARGIDDLRPRAIISTSMMLIPAERRVIERAFGCRVTDRYGCEEVGLIASECERHDGLHLNIDHLYVEFITEDGSPAGPGEEGEIVVTDLINRGMPLIRYRVEDVGVPTDRLCPCGRGLPLMERVVGRVADFLVRRDGALVAGVSLVERTLTAVPGVEQMQIVQERVDRIVLHVVRGEGYNEGSEQRLAAVFSEVFGDDVSVEFLYRERLDQTPSGKYRFAICHVGERRVGDGAFNVR
jgi:phenylacetate-CoA ligase